jgi:hypothetical protein
VIWAGGGGATDIRIGGTALTDRVLVAGGGGGSSGSANTYVGTGGVGGGLIGGDGTAVGAVCLLGTGGTASAGGIGGNTSCWCSSGVTAANGTLGIGASSTCAPSGLSTCSCSGTGCVSGAGGGGGYYGGGAGLAHGGGGGGSSFAGTGTSSVTHTQGYRAGNGVLTLTWSASTYCATSRSAVRVNVVQIEAPIVTNGVRCGTGSVTISAAPTAVGQTIDWYADSLGGAILTGGVGTTTFATPSIAATTVYYAEVRNTSTGCVSRKRTRVIASVFATSASASTQTTCSNQPVLFNGVLINIGGTYLDTFTNVAGCDSVVTLNLTVTPTSTGTVNQTVCAGASYTFNGATLSVTGAYLDTFTNALGCDSVVTLNLTVRAASTGTIDQSICPGDAYLFNGINRTTAGVFKDTLSNITGCDSVVTLNLSLLANSTGTITTTIANGSSYLFNGVNLTQPGVYKDTLTNTAGCDSVVTLNLSVGTAIANIKEATWEMSIYPNPAMSNATVSYTLPTEATILDIILVDAQGKVMMADKVNQPKITGSYPLNLKGIASGLYFVRLTANGYSETRRIVVNKD